MGYNLGSISKGNHLAELHLVHKVKNALSFRAYGLEENALYILVHSSSKGFGQILFDTVARKYDPKAKESENYLEKQFKALTYATQSREEITGKLLKVIGVDEEFKKVSDTAHNSITQTLDGWFH